MKVQHSDYAVI